MSKACKRWTVMDLEVLLCDKEKPGIFYYRTSPLHFSEPQILWSRDTVLNFIDRVRGAGGIPFFRTKYAGQPIRADSHYAILGIAYGADIPSVLFVEVPELDWWYCELAGGEWKELPLYFENKEKYTKELAEAIALYKAGKISKENYLERLSKILDGMVSFIAKYDPDKAEELKKLIFEKYKE